MAGCRVAVESMKAGRIGLYVAGAVIGAGLAYLLAILPNQGPASSETPKPVAKKGEGKARAPGRSGDGSDRHGQRHAGHPGGPGHGRAARQRRRQDARRRTDRRGALQGGRPRQQGRCVVPPRRPDGEGADLPSRSRHRQGPGEPARRRGDVGPARGAGRQEDRHGGGCRPGALCGGGPQGQHRLRPGAAGVAEDPARLSHHPRAAHRPHGSAHLQGRRHGPRRRRGATARDHQPDQADLGDVCRAAGRAWRLAGRAGRQSAGRHQHPRRRQADGRAGHASASSTTRSTSRPARSRPR